MSRVEVFETASAVPVHIIEAGGATVTVVVPDPQLLFGGSYRKVGADLLIEGDGRRVLLQDYFGDDAAPALTAPDGGLVSAATVRALAGLDSPWDFAQAGGGAPPLQIGTVRTLTGSATAQRGGSVQTLAVGDPVFRGDVIETAANGAVGITLVDRTVLSLSASARMVMNELVYDPARTDNSLAVNLVQGSFVFITGQVAKSGSVAVTTPVATMGIRGTTPIVKIDSILGQGEFSLGADPDGTVGSYTLVSVITGQIITSVSTTDIVVRIRSAAGPFEILNKTPGDQTLDTQLLQPAYFLYQLLGQRGEGTGKGQGLTQLAFNADGLADQLLTPLLNDTSLNLFDSEFSGRTRQFDVLLNRDGTVTVVETPRGSLLVDLDPSSDARDTTVTFRENGSALRVAGGVEIAVPTGVTTLTGATVVLTNNQPGDEIIVGTLPAGISVTITSGSIRVNLSGTASVADYIAAIRAIQFVNNSDDPSTQERIVTVTVTLPTGETSTATTTILIVAVNDAPVNVLPGTQAVDEDGVLVFSSENGNAITVSDPDSGSGALTVTITAQNGTLVLAGGTSGVTVSGSGSSTVVITGTAQNINAALEGLTYTPGSNFNGSDALLVSTSDNGNTGEGGVLITTSTGAGVEVEPVNDAPINHLPDSISATEDTKLVFSAAKGNAISISDVDAGTGLLKVTVAVAYGKLWIASSDGASVSGNGTHALTIEGTVSQINAALDGLAYKAAYDYSGDDTLTVTTTDNGNTGSGGALTDTDMRTITIEPVNDAPTTSDVTLGPVQEDGSIRITQYDLLVNARDVDGDPLVATNLMISDGDGRLIDNHDGTWTYKPAANDDTQVEFTYTITDNGTTNGASDPKSVHGSASLDITPVNDAPALTKVSDVTIRDTHKDDHFDPISGTLVGRDIDQPSGEPLVYSLAQGEDGKSDFGTLEVRHDGSYTFTPDDDAINGLCKEQTVKLTFTAAVTDDQGAVATTTISFTLIGARDKGDHNDDGHPDNGQPRDWCCEYKSDFTLSMAALDDEAGITFTGLGSTIDIIDLASDTFAGTTTVAFTAGTTAMDVVSGYDTGRHQLDVSDLLETSGVTAATIQEYISATDNGSAIIVSVDVDGDGPQGAVEVASVTGAGDGLSAGDVLSVVFDNASPPAQLVIS